MLARSKFNSIGSKTSEALINSEITHEGFETVINEEKNYRELKESITMMKTQWSDTEKIIWLKKVKKVGTDEVIKPNEFINNSLKCKI